MELSENAKKVLEARYLRRNSFGEVCESPEELFRRVAKDIALAEKNYPGGKTFQEMEEIFYEVLTSFEFLPNSPTLMNAGTEIGQLSACFVLPVNDSIEDIFETLKNMVMIQRTGGGTGFSFSRIRPRDSIVNTTGGKACGPVSFMKIFDMATEHIKQGGRRRGANMGVLRVDHPDIMEFIKAKEKEGELRNFNLSVGITNEFMDALKNNSSYPLIAPHTKEVYRYLEAAQVFDEITRMAWKRGDPGLLFLDRINEKHPIRGSEKIEATNPCGEVPLLSYESCNLGSINLTKMLKEKNGKIEIDWDKLRRITHIAVRFLDNVIERNKFPLPAIEKMTKQNRKIGLGIMGFADMLIKLEVSYNSKEATELAEKIMSFIYKEALVASEELAEERGVFPNWKNSIYFDSGKKVRNATVTSIAPTGTISIIAATSSGIEPLFALVYKRKNILGGETFHEINPLFLEYCKKRKLDIHKIVRELLNKGSIKQVTTIPEKDREIFLTALEIPYQQHVKIQASFQKYVDNSVSKTINLPQNASVDDVANSYLMAYELGCKGITVYRYGSQYTQVLELDTDEDWIEKEYFHSCDPGECKV